jgi:hypothetical protein
LLYAVSENWALARAVYCLREHVTLQEEELKKAALLVFANKQDLPGALSAADVSKQLGRVTADFVNQFRSFSRFDALAPDQCLIPSHPTSVCYCHCVDGHTSALTRVKSKHLWTSTEKKCIRLGALKNRAWAIFQTSACENI